MPTVTPCRNLVSERFPVASFVVDVPPDRCFELACATDPRLFHPDQRGRRTPKNFWTSRGGGLMRAPSGRATYLLPSEQLRNFAGARRLYYALGSYGSVKGERPHFTVSPAHPDRVPFIQISPDFTGRSLDRRRLGAPVDARYGRKAADLAWGADQAMALVGGGAVATRQPAAVWRGVALEDAPPAASSATAPAALPPFSVSSTAPDEPAGCEHPDQLGRVERSTVELPNLGEPAEPYGRRGARPAAAPARTRTPARAAAKPAYGRRGGAREAEAASDDDLGMHAPDFSDDEEWPEDDATAGAATTAGTAPGEALAVRDLDLDAKFRIVQAVAAFESGLRPGDLDDPARRTRIYGAANRNSDGAGLSWGIIQFTQRGGALGDVLAGCKRRDEARFRAVFGADADVLLATCTAADEAGRMQAVAGADLWAEPWLSRFAAAAAEPAFQAAQNQVAIERYFDPHLPFARNLGCDSERALAMLYDRCVQQGNGGGPRWIMRVLSPIRNRVTDLPRALAALGAADLAAFQRGVPGLAVDGKLGTQTLAALTGALRQLGTGSPFPIPDREGMLDLLVTAAQNEAAATATDRERTWMRARARRLAALRTSADIGDDTFAWA